jgi:hypothetical protein
MKQLLARLIITPVFICWIPIALLGGVIITNIFYILSIVDGTNESYLFLWKEWLNFSLDPLKSTWERS